MIKSHNKIHLILIRVLSYFSINASQLCVHRCPFCCFAHQPAWIRHCSTKCAVRTLKHDTYRCYTHTNHHLLPRKPQLPPHVVSCVALTKIYVHACVYWGGLALSAESSPVLVFCKDLFQRAENFLTNTTLFIFYKWSVSWHKCLWLNWFYWFHCLHSLGKEKNCFFPKAKFYYIHVSLV